MKSQDTGKTQGVSDLYDTMRTYRMIFQLFLFFLLASSVIYTFSIFTLLDDRLNASPQPEALMGFTQWVFAFPVFTQLIVLYIQFAFSLNRRSCMSPMFWTVFTVFILALAADVGYIMYLWFAKCKGVVDLIASPELGYCSDGAAVRWQFMFTLWSLVAMLVTLVLTAIILGKIFGQAKTIVNDALALEPVEAGRPPTNTVLRDDQIGAPLLTHEHAADLFVLELLGKHKKFK
jgi:hypothetical protein